MPRRITNRRLLAAFLAGRSVLGLARTYGRTVAQIEARLRRAAKPWWARVPRAEAGSDERMTRAQIFPSPSCSHDPHPRA
jgi:hypothetical protein